MLLLIGSLFVLAVKVCAQFQTDQTPPFNLVLSSPNTTINGSILFSCHEGAAIQALCLTKAPSDSSAIYRLNYTSQRTYDLELGITGILTWELQGFNFNASTSLKLAFNPISNIAVPLLTPVEGTTVTVGFDQNSRLYIPGYADDTNLSKDTRVVTYRRWFVCDTNAGYSYKTLAWVVGLYAQPQNPTCQKVEVIRRYVQGE